MACDKTKLKPINSDTKAVVVGAQSSGQAVIRLLRHFGVMVRVLDTKPENIPDDFKEYMLNEGIALIGGEHKAEYFIGADIVIPSPGVPVTKILPFIPIVNPPDIVGETEIAWRYIQNEAILAITGTSGKTTTTALASAMLEEHKLKVFTGGNIGTPLSTYILEREINKQEVDIVVLELSSFQLQACQTLKPRVALLLNVSENHLDHHENMKEYVDAKMRIFRCQDALDVSIFPEDLRGLAHLYRVPGRRVFFNDTILRFTKSNLFGHHNMLNAEAAYRAVKEFGVSQQEAALALEKFKPIENRLENVLEYKNILFVNDSKSTTVESLKVALQAFDRPILLLAGGKFKGGDLESLVPLLKEKVRAVCLYGASRESFEKAWKNQVPLTYKKTLKEAMITLYKVAEKNDIILLSPATASYDQYTNYEERGKDFRKIAHTIASEE